MRTLAEVRLARGERDEALAAARAAHERAAAHYGDEDHFLDDRTLTLARCHAAVGDDVEAESLFRRAASLDFPAGHPGRLRAAKALEAFLRERGRVD